MGYTSYPCIIYGSTPELINPTVQSTQVANFANLSTSYSISISGTRRLRHDFRHVADVAAVTAVPPREVRD